MKENENINPENYWKDAEKLLNRHFKAKRKRKIIVLLFLLFLGSTGLFSVLQKEARKETTAVKELDESTPALQRSTNEIKIGNDISANSNNITNIERDKSSSDKMSLTGTVAMSDQKDISIPVNSRKRMGKGIRKEHNTNSEVEIASNINHSSISVNKNRKLNTKSTPPKTQSEELLVIQTEIADLQKEIIKRDEKITEITEAVNQNDYQQAIGMGLNNYSLMSKLSLSSINIELNKEIQFDYPITLPTKLKPRLDILVYGGASLVGKKLNSTGNSSYLQRRNEEESSVLLPNIGLQLSKNKGHWDFRAGFELSVLGEKIHYTPYSRGEYYNSYKDWQTYQYTVSDTDSTYIFGILFLQAKDVIVNDSILVDKTDTLNGNHYNSTIQTANGVNNYYVLEIPLDVTYQFILGRFGAGISIGISPGIVLNSKGSYLRNEESSTANLKNENSRPFTFNARAGIELSYLLTERMRILLRPTGRIYFTEIKEKYGAGKCYNGFGAQVGIMYNIR